VNTSRDCLRCNGPAEAPCCDRCAQIVVGEAVRAAVRLTNIRVNPRRRHHAPEPTNAAAATAARLEDERRLFL
jgi:hypothetical protein